MRVNKTGPDMSCQRDDHKARAYSDLITRRGVCIYIIHTDSCRNEDADGKNNDYIIAQTEADLKMIISMMKRSVLFVRASRR